MKLFALISLLFFLLMTGYGSPSNQQQLDSLRALLETDLGPLDRSDALYSYALAQDRAVREYGQTEPGKVLDKVREIVVAEFDKSDEEVKDGMDIALCSLKGRTISYSGAYNPLWIVRSGEILETKGTKEPVGKSISNKPFETHMFELEPNDVVYVFSDGYVDQFGGPKGKKYKSKNFKSLLVSQESKSMEEQLKIIDESFEKWRGDLEQIDDVCVIGVRV